MKEKGNFVGLGADGGQYENGGFEAHSGINNTVFWVLSPCSSKQNSASIFKVEK
jgi:hypothetical protein